MFGFYSYLISSAAYGVLLVVSLLMWRKSFTFFLGFLAFAASLIWSLDSLSVIRKADYLIQDTLPYESLRNLLWFLFLSALISRQQFNNPFYLLRTAPQSWFVVLFCILVTGLEIYAPARYFVYNLIGMDIRPFGHLFYSLIGLMLVEQLYRNAYAELRWSIKFACLGLAVIFLLDFVLYSKSILFKMLDQDFWESRGLVNAFMAPMVLLSMNRIDEEYSKFQVSNQVVFHTTVLFGSGIYLLIMALAGYYLKEYGGSWGQAAQISFLFLAVFLLLIFFFSGKIRALAKVYFSKHLFKHRYDYRVEWINLSHSLLNRDSQQDLAEFIVKFFAQKIDSSSGAIWIKQSSGYALHTTYNIQQVLPREIRSDDSVIQFLKHKQWIIDFVEFLTDPDMYENAGLHVWYDQIKNICLIIPLFHHDDLLAFVVITQPRLSRQMDWQDHDLLKTSAMQLANALALNIASQDLSRVKQFEAYNRLSAFLVHDLKNLVAQIAMIVKNSEKHKHNPEFIDDSIETLQNVVKKIEHILGQLKKGNIKSEQTARVNLREIIHDVQIQQSHMQPQVDFLIDSGDYWVQAEKFKLISILGHLVQNAQEATSDDGQVSLHLSRQPGEIVLEIADTGCGMDEVFIQQRLFKPFDTTKGNAGMGIGVYEANEYIQQLGGKIHVTSQVGQGTTFTMILPLQNKQELDDVLLDCELHHQTG